LARAAGFPVDNFDRLIFYVQGYGSADSTLIMGITGAFVTEPDKLFDLPILVHELGHTLLFGHSYNMLCPGPDLVNLPGTSVWNLFFDGSGGYCTDPAGSRATTRIPAPFDGQVSRAFHLSRWHAEHEYWMGFLT